MAGIHVVEDFARMGGIHVVPKSFQYFAADDIRMEVSGEAFISISVEGQLEIIHRRVAVADITDNILLSIYVL